MKILRKILLIPACLFIFSGFSQTDENGVDFEIYKNLELLEMVYKTIDLEFVDEPVPGHLMKVAIDAMLSELDPYTIYIPESKMEDYKLMTTGQYGGMGAIIQKKGDHVVITEPHEGFPAQKAGLIAGDKIIAIDGKNVESLSSSEISDKLKGKPGSEFELTVLRGTQKLTKTIVREEIKLSPVPFGGMVSEDVGYIKLTQFTQTASQDVIAQFNDLQKNKGMTKLILDLRGNPGGLLLEAVKIVNMFVSKGQEIVSMRGRRAEDTRTYSGSLKPLDADIPVVVLIDEGSASASEIVSGSLQDLDRAIVVGETSYGKGLVQRPFDLKYNAKIKVTIAKYYTPSGRCIQKLDYSNRESGENPEEISDSLITVFKTRNGREVIDGRGVEPDISVEGPTYSRLTQLLVIHNVIFDFATDYYVKHEKIAAPGTFKITEEDYQDFIAYAMTVDFEYTTASGEMMKKLKETAMDEDFFEYAKAEYEALLAKFEPSKERDLVKFKDEIIEILEDEIIGRYYYASGRIQHSLPNDPYILEAIEILNDPVRYKKILNIVE